MTLLEAISQRVLLGDGAMGTEMQYAGLEPGGAADDMSGPLISSPAPRSAISSSRRTYFLIFPDGVSGKASTIRQCRGALCGASRSRQ